MGNICYAEQNDPNDPPREIPQQFDILVSAQNRKSCDHCEFFKGIDFKYVLQLMDIEGFQEKIQSLAQISIPKRHKQLKIQEQIRFLPGCGNGEFDEIKEYNQVTRQSFSQPQFILVKSITLDVTTSLFQRFLGSPRKRQNYELQKKNQFLFYNRDIQAVALSEVEQLLVFYLRWGVSFENFQFITFDLIKSDYLRFIYYNLKYMFHLAFTLNTLINKYPREDEFLIIYAIIYEQYNIIMWQFQKEYDFCGDGLMGMYHKYFESGNQEPITPEDRMPHFKLISIYQRYWCQRVMNSFYTPGKIKIIKLMESFNQKINFLRQNEQKDNSEIKLLRRVFSQILDCSVNEISIHWVGHQKFDCSNEYLGEFLIELIKQTKDYYQQKYNNLNLNEFSQLVDKDLNLMKSIFPEWIITHFIESIGILKKADKLKDYLQSKLNDQILNIKSSEEINKDFIQAVKQEAELQYSNQQKLMQQKEKIQQVQELRGIVKLQQSEGFIKLILQKVIPIEERSKVQKTALFLDSLSRIQRNNYDVAQLSTTQQIQKPIVDQTTRASDTRQIVEGEKKFYLTDTLINELFEPSQESLDIAKELDENIITYIDDLDRQQKLNNYINFNRDENIYNYVVSLGVSTERSLDQLSFKKNYDFNNFKNIQFEKWRKIKKYHEQQYYEKIITDLEEAIRKQDQSIRNKEKKLRDAQEKLKKIAR